MQKFKFAEFSRKTVFRDFPVNYKEIPWSDSATHNFRKFRIFWDVPEPNRMENDRMHSGTDGRKDGRTDILVIISFDKIFCDFRLQILY